MSLMLGTSMDDLSEELDYITRRFKSTKKLVTIRRSCSGVMDKCSRKRKQDDAATERIPKRDASNASGEESELQEHTYIHELQEIDYGDYRIWARMIKNQQWKDEDTPPNIPMIRGKGKHDVVDTLVNAAVAIIS